MNSEEGIVRERAERVTSFDARVGVVENSLNVQFTASPPRIQML